MHPSQCFPREYFSLRVGSTRRILLISQALDQDPYGMWGNSGTPHSVLEFGVHSPELFRTWMVKIMAVRVISLLPRRFYSLFWSQWKLGEFCFVSFSLDDCAQSLLHELEEEKHSPGQWDPQRAYSRHYGSSEAQSASFPPSSPKPLRTAFTLKSIAPK